MNHFFQTLKQKLFGNISGKYALASHLKNNNKIQPEKNVITPAKKNDEKNNVNLSNKAITVLLDTGRSKLFWNVTAESTYRVVEPENGIVVSFSYQDWRVKTVKNASFRKIKDFLLEEYSEITTFIKSKVNDQVYATPIERVVDLPYRVVPAIQTIDKILSKNNAGGFTQNTVLALPFGTPESGFLILMIADPNGKIDRMDAIPQPDSIEESIKRYSKTHNVILDGKSIALIEPENFLNSLIATSYSTEPEYFGIVASKLYRYLCILSIGTFVCSALFFGFYWNKLKKIQEEIDKQNALTTQAEEFFKNDAQNHVNVFANLNTINISKDIERAQQAYLSGGTIEMLSTIAKTELKLETVALKKDYLPQEMYDYILNHTPQGCNKEKTEFTDGFTKLKINYVCPTTDPFISTFFDSTR
jgi:hypothetical protein